MWLRFATTIQPDDRSGSTPRGRSSLVACLMRLLCSLALLSPSAAFIAGARITQLTLLGEERSLAEEGLVASVIVQRHGSAPRRVPALAAVASPASPCGTAVKRPHSVPGHRYTNGLCAPLRC